MYHACHYPEVLRTLPAPALLRDGAKVKIDATIDRLCVDERGTTHVHEWARFKELLLSVYIPTNHALVTREKLYGLQLTGTLLADYISSFHKILAVLRSEASEGEATFLFIHRFPSPYKNDIISRAPNSVAQAEAMARIILNGIAL